MKILNILAFHGCAAFFELKNVCQLSATCNHCRVFFCKYLYSTKCLYRWIDQTESTLFLDNKSLVALTQVSDTIHSLLHIILHLRKSDFELSRVRLARVVESSDEDSSSSEYYGRRVFTFARRFRRSDREQ